MSNAVEQNYRRINTALSVGIAGLLATIGGIWLFQNKTSVFKSPVTWVTEQAIKNQTAMPKFDPAKKIEFDNAGLMKALQLTKEQMEENKKLFKIPTTIRIPTYQPPRTPDVPAFRH